MLMMTAKLVNWGGFQIQVPIMITTDVKMLQKIMMMIMMGNLMTAMDVKLVN